MRYATRARVIDSHTAGGWRNKRLEIVKLVAAFTVSYLTLRWADPVETAAKVRL